MEESKSKVLVGRVVSDKMDKTVVVAVDSYKPHLLYRKIVRRSVKLKVHDEENRCNLGDIVKITGTRPLSRTKRWKVVEIIEKNNSTEVQLEKR